MEGSRTHGALGAGFNWFFGLSWLEGFLRVENATIKRLCGGGTGSLEPKTKRSIGDQKKCRFMTHRIHGTIVYLPT